MAERAGLPNLIVIGSAKCGTTSLHRYLQQHPQITMATPNGTGPSLDNDSDAKEMRFFWRQDWEEKLGWYRSHFEGMTTAIRGEATPAYSAHPFHPGVAERIHSVAPDVRLVYLVRDPIDRVVAHHIQQRVDGERRSLDEWAAGGVSLDDQIVCPSLYATQLEQYLRHFPQSQILVVDQSDLRRHRQATLQGIFGFVGADPTFWSESLEVEHNTRSEKHVLTPAGRKVFQRVLDPAGRRLGGRSWSKARPAVRRRLSARIDERPQVGEPLRSELERVLRPEVDRLRRLTGKSFETWSL